MQPVCAAALITNPALEPSLRAWLSEDVGRGDLTAPALVGVRGRGSWIAKQAGIFCGGVLVEPLFQLLDPAVTVQLLVADGEAVVAGQTLLWLDGSATALVAGTRPAMEAVLTMWPKPCSTMRL